MQTTSCPQSALSPRKTLFHSTCQNQTGVSLRRCDRTASKGAPRPLRSAAMTEPSGRTSALQNHDAGTGAIFSGNIPISPISRLVSAPNNDRPDSKPRSTTPAVSDSGGPIIAFGVVPNSRARISPTGRGHPPPEHLLDHQAQVPRCQRPPEMGHNN